MTVKATDIKLHVLFEKTQRLSPNGKTLPIMKAYLTERGHCTKKFVGWSTKREGLVRLKEDLGKGNDEPTSTFFINTSTAKNGSPMLKLRGGYDANDNKIHGFTIYDLSFFMIGFAEPGVAFTDSWGVQSIPLTLHFDDYYTGEKTSTFKLVDDNIEKSDKVLEAEAANAEFAEEFNKIRSVFGINPVGV